MILWFTGQPGCGKTTIVNHLATILKNPIIMDGDELRKLFNNQNYTRQGRERNTEDVQRMAKFLDFKGFDVLVSLVSPHRDLRERFKEEMGDRLKEFYVHTTEIRGREHYHVEDYEPPQENFIDLDTTDQSVEEVVATVLFSLK